MCEPQVLLVASSTEGNITAWDVATGTALTTYKANASPPNGLCPLGRDYLLAVQTGKGSLHAWAWHRDHVHQRSFAPELLTAVACTPDGAWCAAGGVSGAIFVWETSSGRLLKSWPAHYKAVACLAFSDDGAVLVSGGQDTLVNAWLLSEVLDASAGQQLQVGGAVLQPLHSWSDHTLPVTALAVGAGALGALVASASLDRSVKLRSLGDGLLLRSVALPSALHSLALDPGEHVLYVGSSTGAIYAVDLVPGSSDVSNAIGAGTSSDGGGGHGDAGAQGAGVAAMEGHGRAVTCLALTSDGELLVSGSEDASVRVWEVRSRQQVRLLQNPAKGPVTSVLVLDRPPHMQVGGAHLAAPSAFAEGGRKGPRRPQPLAAFSKYPGAPGALKPWEGGLVVIDGSSALDDLLAPAGGLGCQQQVDFGSWGQAPGAAPGCHDVTGAGAMAAGGTNNGNGGSGNDDVDALREENERLRQQLEAATGMMTQWGKLNGQLQGLCSELTNV